MSAPRVVDILAGGITGAQALEAADVIARGGIVVHPTETLYGLAVDPWNEGAVARLGKVKERGTRDGFILLVAGMDQARALVAGDAPEGWLALASEFWPGPLTLILPPGRSAPRRVIGDRGGIAVRLTPDPTAAAIVLAWGRAITSTSANRKGSPPVATGAEAALVFGADVDLVIDSGPIQGGVASTILDLTGPEPGLLREGAVSRGRIEACLARARLPLPNGGTR